MWFRKKKVSYWRFLDVIWLVRLKNTYEVKQTNKQKRQSWFVSWAGPDSSHCLCDWKGRFCETLASNNFMKLNCCVLSVSQERVPVRSTLLNMKKAAHSKNVPSAITAAVFFHSVKAMLQLLYSASSNLFLFLWSVCADYSKRYRWGLAC